MGNVTQDSISRAVLRSQPPHGEDVPDMVSWYVRWGEGPHLPDICRFLQLSKVPTSRRIPGRYFRAMAQLEFGVKMPSHVMAGVLKRVASSKVVLDNVPSDYKSSEIASLARKDNIDMVLKANDIILNTAKVFVEKGISDPEKTLELGWMQMTMVDHILKKPNLDGDTFKDLAAIAQEALRRVFNDDPAVCDLAKSSTSSSATSALQTSTVVQYSTTGEAIGIPKLALEKAGYRVGKCLSYCRPHAHKTDPQVPTSYFKIIDIDENALTKIQKFTSLGELEVDKNENEGSEVKPKLLEVSGVELQTNFRPCEYKVKFITGYPKNEVKYNDDNIKQLEVNKVKECLMILARDMADHSLKIRSSPSKGIVSDDTKPIKPGVLCLFPFGNVTKPDFTSKDQKQLEPKNTVTVLLQMPVSYITKCHHYLLQTTRWCQPIGLLPAQAIESW